LIFYLIVNYWAITKFAAAPPPPDSDDDNNDGDHEDNDHADNPQEACIMSKATTKTSAAAAAAKKTATAKMTGKTEADYCLMAPSVHLVLKCYGLGTDDKFAVSFDTKGLTNFVLVQFYMNDALPEKGRCLTTLLDDSHTIKWSRPIDLFIFTMEHLCSISMGSKYLELNIQVCLFDKVMQAILKDKIKPNANRNYWGKPQEIHLKKRCTGTPKTVVMPYKAPYPLKPTTNARGCRHYQFHTIVLVKVQLADKHLISKKNTKTKLIGLYKVKNNQGSTHSPGACHGSKKCNWGSGHCEERHKSRVSKDVEESNHS
jgi:hypothetical protein